MLLWFYLIYFWIHTTVVFSQGFYKVTGSKEIRPYSDYRVSVTTQRTSIPTFFDVIIEGLSNDGRRFRAQESVRVSPYSTEIVSLKVGDVKPGHYSLSVMGRNGVSYQQTAPLIYSSKTFTVLIQTDKGVYNPGNKIMFRTLILNSQLRPVEYFGQQKFDVTITDGESNKVKVWKNAVASKGVFSEEFLLSEHPVLGNWNISVTIEGQVYNKTFEVAKYIFPKFMVNIQAPRYVTFKENILTTHIQSFYDYGKKVIGNATVTVYPTIVSGVIQPIFQNPLRKVVPINGSTSVSFDINQDLQLSDEYERTVIVDVTIEENLTARKQNNSVEVHIRKFPFKMEIIKTSDYYKPGLPYTAFVKVTNQDDTPVKDKTTPVKVKYGFSRIGEVYVEQEFKLDDKGLIKLKIDTPTKASNVTALRIEADYKDLKERMSPVPSAVSLSNTYLQVSLITDKIIVNNGATVVVNCTEPMKYISYEIISKGDIVVAHFHSVPDKNEFTFHFTANHAMVPISHLIVNYVREDGELVADSIDIQVDGILQNFVDIQLSRTQTSPNSEIDITVKAEPNSKIGLLAIDQNVANLRGGYDITQDVVFKELLNYDPSHLSPYWTVMKDVMSHFSWKPGGSNAKDIYEDSGAVLLTNSLVPDFRPTLNDIYLRPVFYEGSTVKPDTGVGLHLPTATRPPLAGPYAFSRIPKPVWNIPRVHLQHNVADTWLFTNFSSGYQGKASLHQKVPNSVTNWIITGFSLNSAFGLGISTTPKILRVSKRFSIDFDIPPSIQRYETLTIPVVIQNNMADDISFEIMLKNVDNNFKFTRSNDDSNVIDYYKKRTLVVEGNSAHSTSFMITLTKIGTIPINITAFSTMGEETVTKDLRVKAEGETQYFTNTLLIDLRNTRYYKGNVSLKIPKNAIPDSTHIDVSVVGDILGPTIMNLEHLIRLPTGCGEQNIVHLMPDLIILEYLSSSGQYTPAIELQAVSNLEKGYQTQLSYRRSDGSFSAFGNRDEFGSIWITSYTVLALTKAKQFIYVDDNVIQSALKWLYDKSYTDGSFIEVGPIIYHEMQSKPLALTAFVMLALIESKAIDKELSDIVGRGLDYVGQNIDETTDVHTLSVCSYVLKLASHPRARFAFNILESKAKQEGNKKWWARDEPEKEMKNPWNNFTNSINIETTSYGLLTTLAHDKLEDAIPIINWLIRFENDLGAFTSSHDTVLGLYAIYQLLRKLSVKPSIEVQYIFDKNHIGKWRINENSALVVQKSEIPSDVRKINVTAEGSGIALFRVSYKYNVDVTGPWPLFTLDPQVDKNSNKHHLQVSICTGFASKNLTKHSESNMAIMEVNLPSGFTADIDALPSLEVSQNVQKVETKNGHTTVVLYFNNLTIEEYCPTVSAYRTHMVANQKPVAVNVYDYYDRTRRARVFYRGTTSTLCEVCEIDCDDFCAKERKLAGKNDPQKAEDEKSGEQKSASNTILSLPSLFIFMITAILRS